MLRYGPVAVATSFIWQVVTALLIVKFLRLLELLDPCSATAMHKPKYAECSNLLLHSGYTIHSVDQQNLGEYSLCSWNLVTIFIYQLSIVVLWG